MSNLYRVQKGIIAVALLGVGFSAPSFAVDATINAKYETKGYFDAGFDFDSDADDPAIWVHPTTKSKSLVIASLKNGGAAVFNLQGVEVQRILALAGPTPDDESGRLNNVDLLYGFSVGGTAQDLAVFSDRGRDVLEIYKINKSWSSTSLPLSRITAAVVPYVFSTSQAEVNDQRTAYGLATHNFGGSTGAIGFVTQRERAKLAKVKFKSVGSGSSAKVGYDVVGYQQFPSVFTLPNGASWTPCMDEDGVEAQFEGLVIDKDTKKLYAGQEPVGIWRMGIDFSSRTLIEKVKTYGGTYTRTWDPEEEEFACEQTAVSPYAGQHLAADAEGLTIYYSPIDSAERLLFASSQGDNTFHVWDIDSSDHNQWEYEGSFEVVYNGDLNEESDGSHIVSAALDSGDYSMGLFVSQDGDNTPEVLDEEGEKIDQTNFKFTPAKRIISALELDID